MYMLEGNVLPFWRLTSLHPEGEVRLKTARIKLADGTQLWGQELELRKVAERVKLEDVTRVWPQELRERNADDGGSCILQQVVKDYRNRTGSNAADELVAALSSGKLGGNRSKAKEVRR